MNIRSAKRLKTNIMKTIISLLIILISLNVFSAETSLERVEPMFWWTGMESPELQLLVYGVNISSTDVVLEYPGVELVSVTKTEIKREFYGVC